LKSELANETQRDMMYTRLRGLPYTEYDIVIHDDFPYLYGLTKDVVMPWAGINWSWGEYKIYVPLSFFPCMRTKYTSNSSKNHFVPVRDEFIWGRTPHHYANKPSETPFSVLDMNPATCWGSFNGVVQALVDECDVIELMRTLYIYLTRYDDGSVYTNHFRPNKLDTSHSGFPFVRAL
jgi:hypothetical protein